MKKLMLHTRFCTIKLMKDLNGKTKGKMVLIIHYQVAQLN